MTAKKDSLLARGVLKEDFADMNSLLHSDNVDEEQVLNVELTK